MAITHGQQGDPGYGAPVQLAFYPEGLPVAGQQFFGNGRRDIDIGPARFFSLRPEFFYFRCKTDHGLNLMNTTVSTSTAMLLLPILFDYLVAPDFNITV